LSKWKLFLQGLYRFSIRVGGYPRGRVIEIYGPESSERPLTLHAIAEAQKQAELLFIDAEHAFDRNYAEKLGVDIEPDYFSTR
jgi:recombination protein RecA